MLCPCSEPVLGKEAAVHWPHSQPGKLSELGAGLLSLLTSRTGTLEKLLLFFGDSQDEAAVPSRGSGFCEIDAGSYTEVNKLFPYRLPPCKLPVIPDEP